MKQDPFKDQTPTKTAPSSLQSTQSTPTKPFNPQAVLGKPVEIIKGKSHPSAYSPTCAR